MPFITNQWLRHLPDRVRPHEPVQTELRFEDITDDWCRTNRIKASLKLHRDGGQYQAVFLTQKDLAFLAPKFAAVSDAKTRAEIALTSLQSLDGQVAAEVLSKYFASQAAGAK